MDQDASHRAEEAPRPRLAVVALGGNALLPADDLGTPKDQIRAARRIAKPIVSLVREGLRVLVVHGNGPQVGRELLRSEEAATKVPPRALQHCVASTQGTMGYLLTQALRNVLRTSGVERQVTSLLTQVLVSPDDPAFDNPTKPIGPFYSSWRARELTKNHGWQMVEDAGRGWRQIVPSPRPIDVLDIAGIEALVDAHHVVIAGGGGGVPVSIDSRGNIAGVSGVVDKDRTAALLANLLGADLFIVLTAVDHIYLNFGKTDQRALEHTHREELRALLAEGQFPPGNMGPKIEAALDFLDDGGAGAIITSARKLTAALADRAGTRITRDPHDVSVRRQLALFPRVDDDEPGETPAGVHAEAR